LIYITVSGGSGSVVRNFGNEAFGGVSIVSPDDTPMFDFAVEDSDGHILCDGYDIDVQKSKITQPWGGDGRNCTLRIFDAVDDGIYQVKPIPKK
jgi:hypothetical protein